MSSEQYDSLKGYKYISNIFLEFPRLGPQWHSEFFNTRIYSDIKYSVYPSYSW